MSMQSIMSAASSLSRLQTMQSVSSRNEGQINVLKAEIQSDGGNEHKEKKVEELTEKSESITESLMKEMSDVNESMKPENDEEAKAEEAKAEAAKEKAKDPKTDKLEISAQYTGADGKSINNDAIAAISAAPVTYHADGKKAEAAGSESMGEIDELA